MVAESKADMWPGNRFQKSLNMITFGSNLDKYDHCRGNLETHYKKRNGRGECISCINKKMCIWLSSHL